MAMYISIIINVMLFTSSENTSVDNQMMGRRVIMGVWSDKL